MLPRQKNWVFLACMFIVALFSVAIVFQNVRYQGRALTQSRSAANIQEIMAEIATVEKPLTDSFRNGTVNRHEVYSQASRLAVLLDNLVGQVPENPTAQRIGDWDLRTTKAVLVANRLADLAGDPSTDWTLAAPAFRSLKKTCLDCHQQFRKE